MNKIKLYSYTGKEGFLERLKDTDEFYLSGQDLFPRVQKRDDKIIAVQPNGFMVLAIGTVAYIDGTDFKYSISSIREGRNSFLFSLEKTVTSRFEIFELNTRTRIERDKESNPERAASPRRVSDNSQGFTRGSHTSIRGQSSIPRRAYDFVIDQDNSNFAPVYSMTGMMPIRYDSVPVDLPVEQAASEGEVLRRNQVQNVDNIEQVANVAAQPAVRTVNIQDVANQVFGTIVYGR